MIKIRPLQKEDSFENLISLSKDFFEEYESFHEDFFKIDRLRDRDIVDYFSGFIDHADGKTYIAIDDEKIIGYITVYVKSQPGYWKIKKVGDISGLMVRKEYRRRGIGQRLLSEAASFFKSKGVKYFTLFTSSENHTALKFYEKCGLTTLYTTMLGDAEKDRI
jgi:ribosomal protein S18 acetylase RimI-like enzyme